MSKHDKSFEYKYGVKTGKDGVIQACDNCGVVESVVTGVGLIDYSCAFCGIKYELCSRCLQEYVHSFVVVVARDHNEDPAFETFACPLCIHGKDIREKRQ